MLTWPWLIIGGIALMVLGVSGAVGDIGILLLLIGFLVMSAGILYRPKEIHARIRHAALDGAGASWGAGVGPVPGQPGPVIPAEQLPPLISRRYTGYSREFMLELAEVDAQLLVARGYYRVSSTYAEGQWRSVDWLAGVVFLFLFFIVGLVWLIHMASNKPVGTQFVTYERMAAVDPHGPPPRPRFLG